MSVMYHVAPAGQQQAIMTHGLDGETRRYESAPRPFGRSVYVFSTLSDALEWKRLEETNSHYQGPHDLWQVDVEGLRVQPDTEDLGFGVENSYVVDGPISPDRLRMMTPNSAGGWEPRQASRLSAEIIRNLLSPESHLSFEKLASMYHDAAWADVAAKAKRLVQQGKVTILRNAPHHIMAHVIGDGSDNGGTPDEHDVEISRHDPNSQIIEQWNCSCAWAQYAFDRTRKWKKFESRPCSHVLATYWKARSTPLDLSEGDGGFQVPRGQTGPAQAPGQMKLPGMEPSAPDGQRQFSPDEQGLPNPEQLDQQSPAPAPAQQQLPSTQDLAIPKQPESPFAPPPKAQPPQREQLQLFDITAPPGMQPMPSAQPVSIPGGRPPTPGNPVQFPGTFSHFIPVITVRSSHFIMAGDALTDYFETQRAAGQPIYVALTNAVALERSGGKIPTPGAQPYGTSSEGIPLYRVMDLGWNPDTQRRENADVNVLQGAPEQTGTYTDVTPGRRAEVLDFDSSLRMAYIAVPLNYPEGGDIRLHPHSLKGWVDYADIRPVQGAKTPWRSR